MAETSKKTPKTFIKAKVGEVTTFRSPSRFSGGGFQGGAQNKSQYKPQAVRVTQHKG